MPGSPIKGLGSTTVALPPDPKARRDSKVVESGGRTVALGSPEPGMPSHAKAGEPESKASATQPLARKEPAVLSPGLDKCLAGMLASLRKATGSHGKDGKSAPAQADPTLIAKLNLAGLRIGGPLTNMPASDMRFVLATLAHEAPIDEQHARAFWTKFFVQVLGAPKMLEADRDAFLRLIASPPTQRVRDDSHVIVSVMLKTLLDPGPGTEKWRQDSTLQDLFRGRWPMTALAGRDDYGRYATVLDSVFKHPQLSAEVALHDALVGSVTHQPAQALMGLGQALDQFTVAGGAHRTMAQRVVERLKAKGSHEQLCGFLAGLSLALVPRASLEDREKIQTDLLKRVQKGEPWPTWHEGTHWRHRDTIFDFARECGLAPPRDTKAVAGGSAAARDDKSWRPAPEVLRAGGAVSDANLNEAVDRAFWALVKRSTVALTQDMVNQHVGGWRASLRGHPLSPADLSMVLRLCNPDNYPAALGALNDPERATALPRLFMNAVVNELLGGVNISDSDLQALLAPPLTVKRVQAQELLFGAIFKHEGDERAIKLALALAFRPGREFGFDRGADPSRESEQLETERELFARARALEVVMTSPEKYGLHKPAQFVEMARHLPPEGFLALGHLFNDLKPTAASPDWWDDPSRRGIVRALMQLTVDDPQLARHNAYFMTGLCRGPVATSEVNGKVTPAGVHAVKVRAQMAIQIRNMPAHAGHVWPYQGGVNRIVHGVITGMLQSPSGSAKAAAPKAVVPKLAVPNAGPGAPAEALALARLCAGESEEVDKHNALQAVLALAKPRIMESFSHLGRELPPEGLDALRSALATYSLDPLRPALSANLTQEILKHLDAAVQQPGAPG